MVVKSLTGLAVVVWTDHNLRGTVPSRCYVFSHGRGIFVAIAVPTGHAKVAYFDVAANVDEDVC